MRYEKVLIGKGNRAHLRYDDRLALCGSGPVDNSKPTTGYPVCQRCQKLYMVLTGRTYEEDGKDV